MRQEYNKNSTIVRLCKKLKKGVRPVILVPGRVNGKEKAFVVVNISDTELTLWSIERCREEIKGKIIYDAGVCVIENVVSPFEWKCEGIKFSQEVVDSFDFLRIDLYKVFGDDCFDYRKLYEGNPLDVMRRLRHENMINISYLSNYRETVRPLIRDLGIKV